MKTAALIFVVVAVITVQVVAGTIESMGVNTVEDARADLTGEDYRLNLRNGAVFSADGFVARILDLKKSPALGGKDVQFQFADANIDPGRRFLRHFHPRSSELINLRTGRLEVNIEFEDGSIKSAVLRKNDIFVIPQGLIHDALCISSTRCRFVATFRTADPGLIPLPFRE